MIKLREIISCLIVITVLSSCGSGSEQSEKTNVEVSTENLIVADYAIEGMVCAMGCAATIEKDVAGMDGIALADVDYEAGKAHFEFDKEVVSEKEIIAKIESIADGQYKVTEWVESNEVEEVEASEEEIVESNEGSITEVSLPSFEIPNLFTLLLDRI